MAFINLSTGIRPGTQIPLDDKAFVMLKEDLIDLGQDNYKAFSYHIGMRVFCVEDYKVYIWKPEIVGSGISSLPREGLLPDGFTYPPGSISNGYDYSDKRFNFFVYYPTTSITPQSNSNRIKSGSVYWTTEGLNFMSTPIVFDFNGIEYTVPPTLKTLSNGDANYDRIDVFAVDISGELVLKEGVPSATPQEPTIDFRRELRLTSVYVPAGATQPQGASYEAIYNENLGWPAEWKPSFENAWDEIPTQNSIIFNSQSDPQVGAYCIEGNYAHPTDIMKLENQNTSNVNEISSLYFLVKSIRRMDFQINIKVFNANMALLGDYNLLNGQFGLDTTDTSNYHAVNIPWSLIVGSGDTVGEVKYITMSFSKMQSWGKSTEPTQSSTTLVSFLMDDIKFLYGSENPNYDISFFDLVEVSFPPSSDNANKMVGFDSTGKKLVVKPGGSGGIDYVVTPDTGSDISLTHTDNACNMTSPNSNTIYSITGLVKGSEATVLINTSVKPKVLAPAGVTIEEIFGHIYDSNIDMHLKIKARTETLIEYYFLRII